MAEFASSGVTDPTPNIMVNIPAALQQAQQLQAGNIANQQNALALNYAQQTQPAKINALMSAVGDAQAQAPQPAAPSGPQPQPTSAMVQNGPPLLYGDTPVSADPDTQNAVRAAAAKLGMNPEWAARVQNVESGGVGPNKIADVTSPAGAIGPMQLMPGTAKDLGVDPTDPQQNIQGGVAYLKQLRQQFGSPALATAAYNAGPQRVQNWLAGKGSLPAQTVAYVGKVAGNGDGMSLLNDALAGYHGSIPGHDSDMGDTMFKPPGTGLQLVPGSDDPVARAAMRQLMAKQQLAMITGDMRAASQFEGRIDNIVGPGGVPAPDGSAHVVPGSLAARYYASQATKAGEIGPASQLNNANTTFNQAAAQQTHAVNAQTDVATDFAKPRVLAPNDLVATPSQLGIGGAAQPASVPGAYVDPGADPSQSASPAVSVSPAGTPGPGFRVPPAPVNVPAVQTQIYKEDRDELDPVLQAGQDAQSAQIRTRELRDDFAKNYSGQGAPSRVALQNFVQSNFGNGAASDFAKKITGISDLSAAQEAAKLALVNAGNQERGALGARGSLGAINLYKDANPNIALQPDAINRITNMQLIAQQADADYAQAAAQHVRTQGASLLQGGGYQPLDNFKQSWQASRPAQVYAAAMSAVNGDPFEKWSKNLSPTEGQRVVGILTRADPGAPIQWKGGQTFHVPSGAPAQ